MEGMIIGGVLLLLALIALGSLCGIVALARLSAAEKRIDDLARRLRELQPRPTMQPEEAVPFTAPPLTAPPPSVPVSLRRPETPAEAPPPFRVPPPAPEIPFRPAAPASPPRPAPLPRPARPEESWEARIGKKGTIVLGALAVFVGLDFFLKHAFSNGWIGPQAQVALGAFAGVAALLGGNRLLRGGVRLPGQGVIGLGLAILYAVFFASFSLYSPAVLGQEPAFGFMALVTAAGIFLAIGNQAVFLAVCAVVGGFATPLLLSTGQNSRDALCLYMLLLDAGVLAVAYARGWLTLERFAFFGTFLLFGGWVERYYEPGQLVPAAAWLAVYFLIFLLIPFGHALRTRHPVQVGGIALLVANAAVSFGLAWYMLRDGNQELLGFLALAFATAHLAFVPELRRRLPDDRRSLLACVALAAVFVTLAAPLQLRADGITLAWAAEAPLLVWLGYRYAYAPLRICGSLVLILSVYRLFSAHWPLHSRHFLLFQSPEFLSAIVSPLAMAAAAWIHQQRRAEGTETDRKLKIFWASLGGLVGLVVLDAEIGGWLAREMTTTEGRLSSIAVWLAGALAFGFAAVRTGSAAPRALAGIVALYAAGLSLYGFSEQLWQHTPVANLRFLLCVGAAVTLFGSGRLQPKPSASPAARVLVGAGILHLLIALSLEAYSSCIDWHLDEARRIGQIAVTMVWTFYAAALLAIGFWRERRPLRLAALALFAASALKLVLVDLTHADSAWRILSFVGLGLVLIAASVVYHRLEKRFLPSTGAEPPPGPGEQP